MLINFISNAIKFTKPGTFVEVILSAKRLNLPREEGSNIYSKHLNENMMRAIEEFQK
jgi:hypothetical protein